MNLSLNPMKEKVTGLVTANKMTPESTRVKHWKEECAYLITIPRYYFKNNIEYWNISPVGQYISDVLSDAPEQCIGVYIFQTENGDAHENVSQIFEFMLENEENLCTIYTFSQCHSCKQIGTVREKFQLFNFIMEEKCEFCTYCSEEDEDVSPTKSESQVTI